MADVDQPATADAAGRETWRRRKSSRSSGRPRQPGCKQHSTKSASNDTSTKLSPDSAATRAPRPESTFVDLRRSTSRGLRKASDSGSVVASGVWAGLVTWGGDGCFGDQEQRRDGRGVLERGPVTLAGSRMPAAIMSTYSPVAALRPQPVVRLRTFSTTTPASRPVLMAICLRGASAATRTMFAPVASSPARSSFSNA